MITEANYYRAIMDALVIARSFFTRVVCESGRGRFCLEQRSELHIEYPSVSLALVDSQEPQRKLPTLRVSNTPNSPKPSLEFLFEYSEETANNSFSLEDNGHDELLAKLQEQTSTFLQLVAVTSKKLKQGERLSHEAPETKPQNELPQGKDMSDLEKQLYAEDNSSL